MRSDLGVQRMVRLRGHVVRAAWRLSTCDPRPSGARSESVRLITTIDNARLVGGRLTWMSDGLFPVMFRLATSDWAS